jgi:hypothetical protein
MEGNVRAVVSPCKKTVRKPTPAKTSSHEEGHKAKRRLTRQRGQQWPLHPAQEGPSFSSRTSTSGSGQNEVATPLQPRETRHWRMACVSITPDCPEIADPPVHLECSMSASATWTKPRFAGSWKVLRFGRAICMLHVIRASAAIRTFLHRSMSESARNCCTALKLHKAIAPPNPHTV